MKEEMKKKSNKKDLENSIKLMSNHQLVPTGATL